MTAFEQDQGPIQSFTTSAEQPEQPSGPPRFDKVWATLIGPTTVRLDMTYFNGAGQDAFFVFGPWEKWKRRTVRAQMQRLGGPDGLTQAYVEMDQLQHDTTYFYTAYLVSLTGDLEGGEQSIRTSP